MPALRRYAILTRYPNRYAGQQVNAQPLVVRRPMCAHPKATQPKQ